MIFYKSDQTEFKGLQRILNKFLTSSKLALKSSLVSKNPVLSQLKSEFSIGNYSNSFALFFSHWFLLLVQTYFALNIFQQKCVS